ncbi:MAG: hypothetical protein HUJ94_03405 [Bacteroidales bacterium]|nr:hypothetical protein [Bacteroidales bacterium]
MADNFLERQMEAYREKLSAGERRKKEAFARSMAAYRQMLEERKKAAATGSTGAEGK